MPLLFAVCIAAGGADAFAPARASTASRLRGGWSSPAASLVDYSGAVSALFDNMRAPAALVAGSLVPLGMLGAPEARDDDTPAVRTLKKAYLLTAILALSGEVTSVVYSTIAINKLAERAAAPATSVVALLARDYELEWLGSNVGFLGGLFGFVGLLGIRAWLAFGPAFGRFGALLCAGVVTHACSVVNAGIQFGPFAAGEGSGAPGLAANFLGLVLRYVGLVAKDTARTRGPLRIISLLCVAGAVSTAWSSAQTKHGSQRPLAD